MRKPKKAIGHLTQQNQQTRTADTSPENLVNPSSIDLNTSDREALIESLGDREIELVVNVENVSFEYTVGLPQEYRGGRIVKGRA